MSLQRLYTAEQVAEAFQLDSTHWLEDSARSGEIPHTRLGRRLRFTYEQVEEIVSRNIVPATGRGVIPFPSTPSVRARSTPNDVIPELKNLRCKPSRRRS